ncbi:MAG TPA: hypothetical protein VND70_02330 [Acidimicrobiales bacterium]|nr:hypothetical protein [Acidimicrobiales bacterium]
MAAATAGGGWCAAVGVSSLGVVAAAEQGVDLDRLALVPAPASRWPVVTAALLDGVDLLLLRPPERPRPGDARRLAARTRERGAVLVVVDVPGVGWPEVPDLRLIVTATAWEGLGRGHGHLCRRKVQVVATGRRAAERERRCDLWLPGPAPLPAMAG